MLYMEKALPMWIYLKEKLFGFKMDENKSIKDCLDEFNKLVYNVQFDQGYFEFEVEPPTWHKNKSLFYFLFVSFLF